MSIETDLKKIALQEKELQFKSFSADVAWLVGCKLRADALARGGRR